MFGNDGPRSAPWALRLFGETGYEQAILVIVDKDRTLDNGRDCVDSSDNRLTPEERKDIKRIGQPFPEAHALALFRSTPMPADQARY